MISPSFTLLKEKSPSSPVIPCPSQIGLPSDGDWAVSGDCFQCQKCIDICPQKHIHCGIRKLKGNEFWFTILRALILLGICLWLGL